MAKSNRDNPSDDETLETLLSFNGQSFELQNGYWVKFEVWIVEPNRHIPHGIRYSLTLHDRYNIRLLGFDNAHGIKPKRKKFGARKITWDHKHKKEQIFPYEYETASQLLEDFFSEVDQVLKRT